MTTSVPGRLRRSSASCWSSSQRLGKDPHSFALVDSSEERQAPQRVGSRTLSGRVRRSREVGNHERPFREAPAVLTHPVEQECTRADDDVRELNRGLLEEADAEHGAEIPRREVGRQVDDVASRAVAEDDEERLPEREAHLPQSQRGVRGRAEVVRDDDVWRLVAQAQHDAVGMRELPGLHAFGPWRHRPDADSGVRVDVPPVGVERARVVLSEQDLHGMTEPGKREREESRRRSHPADGVEPAQLVRDHGHAASRRHPGKPNVTFVADELLGYAGNGIGTTTTFVSLALARRGYDVEVLFARRAPDGPIEAEWQRLYEEAGVRVRVVPRATQRVEPSYFTRSVDVEAALRLNPPDVVVVQDLGAPAYTAIRLRSLGLAFERTSFVVFCHGTRQWVTDVSRKVRVLPGAQAVAVLERASVELADSVVSPSAYLVDWMRGEGWQLPARTYVIPHVSRAGATGEPPPTPARRDSNRVERVAFFGRLEERKGVGPFLAALNTLEPELLERFAVEFIGRPTPPWPVERVRELLSDETRRTLRGLSFETTLDQHEALARLRRPGTMAVMPSFEENSPNTIYECLENGIPFIAGNVAGIRELVATEDHARVLCEPTREGIGEALRRALNGDDELRPARPAFEDAES